MFNRLELLKERGFRPKLAIDVGACAGDWTRQFKQVFPDCRVLMIEARSEMVDELAEVPKEFPGVGFRIACLGASNQFVDFAEMGTGSSVFHEQSNVPRAMVHKKTQRLDDLLLTADARNRPDVIKLDVQGYELEVLKGARWSLGYAQLVITEASLIPLNYGCPLIHEVIAFMEDHNKRLIDVPQAFYLTEDKSLWQLDLFFADKKSQLIPKPQTHFGPGGPLVSGGLP